MGYRLQLNSVDRARLANLLKFAEHALDYPSSIPITGEDIALSQKLRKMLEDTTEYITITDE